MELCELDSFRAGDLYLIAVLGKELALLSTNDLPIERCRHSGTVFTATGRHEMTGFYDWLRNTDGTFIGVRYLPFWDEPMPDSWASLSYANTVKQESFVEIFFGDAREWRLEQCTGGEFGRNWVFRSGDDCYAVAFSMEALSDGDRAVAARHARRLRRR